MRNKYNTLIVGGLGGSGSSAVVDLLKEYEYFEEFGGELRIITDPDGILNLEDSLVHSWTPYQSDIAIKRFKKLVKSLTNKNKLPYFRYEIAGSKEFNFNEITKKYIDELINFQYKGTWFRLRNPKWWFCKNIERIFDVKLCENKEEIYISFPQENFLNITRKYFNNLYNEKINNDNIRNIIIDEGYASLNINRVLNYFNSSKAIIVHRDPRDIYVNELVNMKSDFSPKKINDFIKWYKYLKKRTLQFEESENIMHIDFEELVFDYENITNNIKEFLQETEFNHILKKKYLDPEISKNNIGIWENYPNQSEINEIYKHLEEYCYKK